MEGPGERKKRGRPAGYSPYPAWPEEMVLDAYRILCEGKISASRIYKHTKFPSENSCRKAISNYLFPGKPALNWIELVTYINVKKMQGSPESAEKLPTIFCGDCPMFKADKDLTKTANGRYLRYGYCTECKKRVERCSRCVYGIYEETDDKYLTKVGYHR